MAFSLEAAPVPVRSDIRAAFGRDWARLARPGTWWTGADRIAIATAARLRRTGDITGASIPLPPAAIEAAGRISVEPATATRSWVEGLIEAGLGYSRYVELVGVVSRLSAIDAFFRALGMPLEPLPEAVAGAATTHDAPRSARIGRGRVPMVGGTSIVQALSLVPAEMEAQEDLHGPMYLRYDQMGIMDFSRGLHRTQMELVAGRVSASNECFY
ncbi:MAG: hypothetical protein ACE5GC_03735 [Acidimicrobiia bacterium]